MKWLLRFGEEVIAHLEMVFDRENSRDQKDLRLHHQAIGFGRYRAPQDDRVTVHFETDRIVTLCVERAAQRDLSRLRMRWLGRLAWHGRVRVRHHRNCTLSRRGGGGARR